MRVIEPPAPHLRRTVDVPEAARILGISDRHLYDLINENVVPALKLGRRRVVPVVQIDRMLDDPSILERGAAS